MGLVARVGRYAKEPVKPGSLVIGETGFEPATARPPAGCATRLRHSPWQIKRATGIEPALEAWKASVQPQHFARTPGAHLTGAASRSAPTGSRYRRSSTGTSPDSSAKPARRPGPEPVVAGAVERHRRAVEGAPQRRGEQRHQPGVLLGGAQALERHRARRARAHASGYFAITSVSKCPAATAATATPPAAQRAASSRVSASTVARAAPEWAIPGIPWCGESVTLTIVPPPARLERQLEGGLGHVQHALHVQPPHRPPALRRDQLRRLKNWPPALLTSTSSRPWRSSTAPHQPLRASLALAHVAGHPVAPRRRVARRDLARAACSSTSARRPAIVTLAPQRASSSAVALPSPVPPPVTSATAPSSSPGAKISDSPRPRAAHRAAIIGAARPAARRRGCRPSPDPFRVWPCPADRWSSFPDSPSATTCCGTGR